jgi:hypothetical protein
MAMVLFLLIPARADEGAAALTVHRLETDLAETIESRLLAPLLGPGRGHAIVTLALAEEISSASSERAGSGTVETSSPTASVRSKQRQEARQVKRSLESSATLGLRYQSLKVFILHDAGVPAARLATARQAIVAAFQDRAVMKPEDVRFQAAEFIPDAQIRAAPKPAPR